MRQKLNYDSYIGRFFERETMSDSSLFYKITGYDRKHYIVEEISLFPGSAVKEHDLKMELSFVDAENFKEITEQDYSMAEYLFKMTNCMEFNN